MSTLIKWEEPQSVIDFEWQSKYVPQLTAIIRTCIVSTLILSVPILSAILLWARFALSSTLLGLICTGVIFPAGLSLQLWPYKFGRRCQIGDKVLSKSYGYANYYLSGWEKRPFKWREIKAYEFVNHPELPQIRRLVFSLKGYESEAIFNFSPEEVNEQRLQAILREHLD